MKIDFVNAFNECHRSSFLQQFHLTFPQILLQFTDDIFVQGTSLWEIFNSVYVRCAARRSFRTSSILSCDFGLVNDIGCDSNLLLSLWYLDDGFFMGERKSAAVFLDKVSNIGPHHGLSIMMSKCEVSWPKRNPNCTQFLATVQSLLPLVMLNFLDQQFGDHLHLIINV